MKVLLVTNLFPSPVDPERGVFTLQLAKQLAKICDLTIVCPLPWFPKWKIFSFFKKWYVFSRVPYQYKIAGITIYSPKYPMIPKISEAMQSRLMAFGLRVCISSLHEHKNFDVVNSHWFYPDSVAVDSINNILDIPHIATALGCDVNNDLFDEDKRQAILKMIDRAKALTVVSSDLKRILIGERVSPDKIFTIPNGVDSNHFKHRNSADCRAELKLNKEQNIILYVGRLSEEKNIARMIEAFSKLDSSKDTQDLYIVGEGPLEDSLKNLVIRLKAQQHIHFIGKVEHAKIATWMGAADLFCLPSTREGCPNVILEALGSGRPVLASKVGGIPDMVSENTGILFNPLDIEDIRRSFEQGIDSNWNYENIADSVKKLSWKSAASKYLSVFKNVIV